MALNGLRLSGYDGWEELERRIGTRNYGYKTLKNMVDPKSKRTASDTELLIIGSALGVGPGWWTLDFAQLEDSTLRDEVSALRRSVLDLVAEVAQHERALRELRGQDPRTGSD